jgi:hypothetical protein
MQKNNKFADFSLHFPNLNCMNKKEVKFKNRIPIDSVVLNFNNKNYSKEKF